MAGGRGPNAATPLNSPKCSTAEAEGLVSIGRNFAPPPSVDPEFVPVAVVAGFSQGVQAPQPCRRPKLSHALAPALPCATSRLHRASGNGPSPPQRAGRTFGGILSRACVWIPALAPSRCPRAQRVGSSTPMPAWAASLAAASYLTVTRCRNKPVGHPAPEPVAGARSSPGVRAADSPHGRPRGRFPATRSGPPARSWCAGASAHAADTALGAGGGGKTPPGRLASA